MLSRRLSLSAAPTREGSVRSPTPPSACPSGACTDTWISFSVCFHTLCSSSAFRALCRPVIRPGSHLTPLPFSFTVTWPFPVGMLHSHVWTLRFCPTLGRCGAAMGEDKTVSLHGWRQIFRENPLKRAGEENHKCLCSFDKRRQVLL